MIEPLPLSHFYSTILENEELLNKLSRHHQQDEPDDITALKKELEEDGTVSWSLPIIQTLLLRLGTQVDLITIADEPEDREYEIMVSPACSGSKDSWKKTSHSSSKVLKTPPPI